MRNLSRRAIVIGCVLGVAVSRTGCVPHAATLADGASRWVATWEAAPQLTEVRNLPPAPGLSGSTLRQMIHLSLGGSRWRVRLSNEFGDGPLVIASVHVARATDRGGVIDPAGDVPVVFGGGPTVSIAAGNAAVSDAFDISCAALSDLVVSVYVTSAPTGVTGHPGSRTTSYIASGNHVAAQSLPAAVTTEHWYILSGLQVMASAPASGLVVLGNSIADGRGSGTDKNNRWPDNLSRRLHDNPSTSHVAVLNAGIGGNKVLSGGLGPTALARFERDVLAQAGVRWVIVSEGVNDLGEARGADSSAAVARRLTEAYQEMIRRARARQLRIYGATILPFGGSFYASPEHEAARQTVNAWIRNSGAFDAVIDLDAAMRDPADPSRLRPVADGGDHLHPNEQGYRMMADAIDLGLFGR